MKRMSISLRDYEAGILERISKEEEIHQNLIIRLLIRLVGIGAIKVK